LQCRSFVVEIYEDRGKVKSAFVAAAAILFAWQAQAAQLWNPVDITVVADDDIARHRGEPAHLAGIAVTERRFTERGFNWHVLRFINNAKPDGPLWVVPHDDENAAFEGAIAALKIHGGTLLAINSGPGSSRRQAGQGVCGVKPGRVRSCDPNRNFDAKSPIFTGVFLGERKQGQPIIALHTNGAGAAGDFSLLDIDAFARGRTILRSGAYRSKNPEPHMDNYDTLGLIAYPAREGRPSDVAIACRNALNEGGIHFWHERVGKSDGSLSNYLALERPGIAYFNAESREETDLAMSAARHSVMIRVYLEACVSPKD
jgi:hypothetical protein